MCSCRITHVTSTPDSPALQHEHAGRQPGRSAGTAVTTSRQAAAKSGYA
jgi:hypothetical protein